MGRDPVPAAAAAASRAILLTPPGTSAIAVLRLTGPLVAVLLRDHVSRPIAPGRCVPAFLRAAHANVIEDPIVALADDSPPLDLTPHGGPGVVKPPPPLARHIGFEITSPAP